MTEPCRCPVHDAKCGRAVRTMTLRDWELCSGNCPPERPCTKGESEKYRALWDARARGEPPPKAKPRIRGLGDVVANVTSFFGIEACGSCKERQALFNRLVPFRSLKVLSAVTTAPRKTPALDRALASIEDAGFADPWIFAEPGSPTPEGANVYRHPVQAGAAWNFRSALAGLVTLNKDADFYCVFQDDVLLSKGLWKWLRKNMPPMHDVGVLSLYAACHYSTRPDGWHEPKRAWGALAYVFSNESARRFLADVRDMGKYQTEKHVMRWCKNAGLKYLVHSPSLAMHVGETSTIRGKKDPRCRNCTRWVKSTNPWTVVDCGVPENSQT